MLRAGAFAVIAALVVSAGPGLLPAPSNDPAASDLAAPLAGFPGAELAAGARLDPGEPEPVGTADRQRPTKTTAAKEKAPRGGETTARAAQANGRQDGSVSGRPPRSGLPPRSGGADSDPDLGPGVEVTWPFSFPPPEPPDAGGNQVVVTNWANGSTAFDLETSLQWDADGVIDNENSAYALAACTACRTVATAFQIVAATTPTSTVVPRNLAVAANENCNACVTRAVAVQLVVTLDAMPDPAAKREIERLVASIQAREAAYTAMDPTRVRAELVAAKARALEILAPWLDETEEAPEPEPETGETATTDQSESTESSEPETGETEAASDAPQEQPTTAGGAESSDSETDTPAVEEPAPTAPGDSPPPSDSGSDTTATTPSDDSGTTSSTTEPPAGTPSEEDPTAGQ